MHELSLAVSLVEEAEAIALREGAKKVLSLSLSIGELSGVDAEAFAWAFPLAAEKTKADGAELRINPVPLRLSCRECGAQSLPELPLIQCGSCNSSAVDIIDGQEFVLTSMEVE